MEIKSGSSNYIHIDEAGIAPTPSTLGMYIYASFGKLYGNSAFGGPYSFVQQIYPYVVYSDINNNIAITRETTPTFDSMSGSDNLFLGTSTVSEMNGQQNIFVGVGAGISGADIGGSVIVGYTAAYTVESGGNNVFLGIQTGGVVLESCDNCCFLGPFTATSIVTGLNNATAIGYLTEISVSDAMNLGSGCNVGLNNPTPAYNLDIEDISGACAICVDTSTLPTTPASGKAALYYDGTNFKFVNSAGVVKTFTVT
jgi:hypothetical protein